MAVEAIEYIYLETRNWEKSVEFWQHLGFTLALDLGTSGRLEPPGGGPGIFLEEASPETPLASGIYLGAGRSDLDPSPDVETVGEPISTHWGTQLRVVQDPDRREFFLQSPGG